MDMKTLLATMPQVGRIEWIGLRPKKRAPLMGVDSVDVNAELGLVGDHYKGQSKKRQVTLIQAEYLDVVASILGKATIDPSLTRRNIVVKGINLIALKDRHVQIGDQVILEVTGECHPCSRMEENLGPGGYNAMRSHGGITTRVIQGGTIQVGDAVKMLIPTTSTTKS
ncbi:MAG: MOSC domain-containing protein [Bacteroidota bacterium]